MLIYHPAFDLHHATFRVLQLLRHNPNRHFEVDRILINSFLLLFPSAATGMTFPRTLTTWRKTLRQHHNEYYFAGDIKSIFRRTCPLSRVAIANMHAKSLIDSGAYKANLVVSGRASAPTSLEESIATANARDEQILEFLSALNDELGIAGPNGLKARTGLMEHRYDHV